MLYLLLAIFMGIGIGLASPSYACAPIPPASQRNILKVKSDYESSAKYLDEALTIAKTAPGEMLTEPAILRTKSDLYSAKKQWKLAEQLLVKSINLRKPYAYHDQIALCDIYIKTGQLKKAKKILKQTKSSNYKDAQWDKTQARLNQLKH